MNAAHVIVTLLVEVVFLLAFAELARKVENAWSRRIFRRRQARQRAQLELIYSSKFTQERQRLAREVHEAIREDAQ